MAKKSFIQSSIPDRMTRFTHGAEAFPGRSANIRGYQNLSGAKNQVLLLTIATFTASAVYAVQVTQPNGTVLTFNVTEDGGANVNDAAAQVGAKIASHPEVLRWCDVEVTDDKVRLKARGDECGTLLTSDAKMTAVEEVTQADADYIPFGCVVMRDGSKNGELQGKLPAALTTARSYVLTHGESANGKVVLVIDGATVSAEGADAAALNAALDAVLPVGITSSVSGAEVTIAVDTAGDVFELEDLIGDVELSASVNGDVLHEKIAGLTVRQDMSEEGKGVYPGRKADVIEDESIVLYMSGASADGPLYIGTLPAEAGVVFATRAAGRVYAGSKLRVDEADGNFAIVTIN